MGLRGKRSVVMSIVQYCSFSEMQSLLNSRLGLVYGSRMLELCWLGLAALTNYYNSIFKIMNLCMSGHK